MAKLNLDQIVKKIIVSGFKKNIDEGDIKTELVKAGVPFPKVNSMFNKISIDEGLIIDPAIIRENIEKAVADPGSVWDHENWSDLEASIDAMVSEIDGSTFAMVMTKVRSFCKEEGIVLPKKVAKAKASRARGGKTATAISLLFRDNKQATKQDFYDVIRPLVKAHKNAIDYMNMFYSLSYSIANDKSLEDALVEIKTMAIPENKDII